jgi:hypothetical protein
MIIETQKEFNVFFKALKEKNININEYYYLKALNLKCDQHFDNVDVIKLLDNSLITELSVGGDRVFLITGDGINLLSFLDNFKMNVEQEVSEDFINCYRNKFSRKNIMVSGKMGNGKDLIRKFQEFYKEYNFSTDVILKATDLYISELTNPIYCMQADHFIYKEEVHNNRRVSKSRLAQYCEDIVAGATFNSQERVNKI